MHTPIDRRRLSTLVATALASLLAARAEAIITGISGPMPLSFTAKADHILTGDGGSFLFWGYANGTARAQYPGPTLIVNEGDTVTIRLTNKLPTTVGQKVSIVFPGQEGVVATCQVGTCSTGALTLEAARDETVQYVFTASRPGTYLYHSGTRPELQVDMGLAGALIVRPAGFNPAAPRAYADAASSYDRETLFFLSEIDPRVHDLVEARGVAALDTTDYLSDYFSNYWFVNGRNAPDSMGVASAALYPTQPYNCIPRMHPGERLLMRVVGAGHDLHPFHHHGNHARVIARDGRPLTSGGPGAGLDLSYEVFTIQSVPGETVDAIFTWTGKDLGWDIYGHRPTDPLQPNEWAPDHGKPIPVALPGQQSLTFGERYSGSPFLGVHGSLPPGSGGQLNATAGYTFMWHSHTEKEITNFDIFPGGMMTMLVIEPPGEPIP